MKIETKTGTQTETQTETEETAAETKRNAAGQPGFDPDRPPYIAN